MSSRKGYHFKQSPFFKLQSKARLAALLHLSPCKLKEVSNKAKFFYLEREIYSQEKRKYRQVEVPQYVMKTVHNRITSLMNRIEVPDYILSPGSGKSTIDNALLHQGSQCLFKIDIKSYFPSISKRKIYNFFHAKMECSKDVSAILAEIVTVSGHLPTGSSLSPIMSYHVNSDMWKEISLRAIESGCKLSVWVDDICISGSMIPGSLIWDIKKIIHNHNFSYHKEVFYERKDPKSITGIIVTSNKIMPRKGHYKKLRELQRQLMQESHDCAQVILNLKVQGLKNYIDKVEEANNE